MERMTELERFITSFAVFQIMQKSDFREHALNFNTVEQQIPRHTVLATTP